MKKTIVKIINSFRKNPISLNKELEILKLGISRLKKTDPFINAVLVKYGWSITVHKSLGTKSENILLK